MAGGQVVGAGLTLAVTVGLFAYGGLWLDRQLGTRPWMLLLLVLIGILGGMLHLIRVVAPDMLPFDKPARRDCELARGADACPVRVATVLPANGFIVEFDGIDC